MRIVVGCVLGGLLAVACDEPARVFVGRYYAEDRDCLGTTSSIDVVDGPKSDGVCKARCLVQRSYDGARPVYVTTACPPYPGDSDTSGTDPRCARALEALERNDTCLTDGGSAHPRAPDAVDGG